MTGGPHCQRQLIEIDHYGTEQTIQASSLTVSF